MATGSGFFKRIVTCFTQSEVIREPASYLNVTASKANVTDQEHNINAELCRLIRTKNDMIASHESTIRILNEVITLLESLNSPK